MVNPILPGYSRAWRNAAVSLGVLGLSVARSASRDSARSACSRCALSSAACALAIAFSRLARSFSRAASSLRRSASRRLRSRSIGISISFWPLAAFRDFFAGFFGDLVSAAPPPTLRRSASIRSTTFSPRGRSFGVIGLPARLLLMRSMSAVP